MAGVLLETNRTVVAQPGRSDERAVLAAVVRSLALHHPWVEAPATPLAYRRYLSRVRRRDDFGFLVRHRGDATPVAIININNVVLGPLCSGYLGYYGLLPNTGRGLVTEALAAVVDHAFESMGLHRLEANIQPGNDASLRLVRRCGFRREGLSPRYLHINGAWRDHERWAITVEDRPVIGSQA